MLMLSAGLEMSLDWSSLHAFCCALLQVSVRRARNLTQLGTLEKA